MSANIKWRQMAHIKPRPGSNIVYRYPHQKGMGLGFYSGFADEWDPEVEWIDCDELNKLEVME